MKTIKYKLTNQKLQTYKGFQWEVGKTVTVDGEGKLCSEHKLHYYHNPLLAILLNPIHASISNPRLWEVECGEKGHIDDIGLKGGCNSMTIIREIEIPVITIINRIAFGILCSLEMRKELYFVTWANNWLNNTDRTYTSAKDVYDVDSYAYTGFVTKSVMEYANFVAEHDADIIAEYIARAVESAVESANITTFNLVEIAEGAMKYK